MKLDFFDCTSCGNCVYVCPNGANFFYTIEKKEFDYTDYVLSKPFLKYELLEGNKGKFSINKPIQIAHYYDSCNECGNCETYCPENGAPYKKKPVIISLRKDYDKINIKDTNNLNDRSNVFYIHKNN
ncbi:MAG: 4Fe-4S binding protein, partial [Spirochaetota bacterium]